MIMKMILFSTAFIYGCIGMYAGIVSTIFGTSISTSAYIGAAIVVVVLIGLQYLSFEIRY